jgi:hypothetical protein
MVRATDDSENVEFHGIITVLPHPLPSGARPVLLNPNNY